MTVKQFIEKLKEHPEDYQIEFISKNEGELLLFEHETEFDTMTVKIKLH